MEGLWRGSHVLVVLLTASILTVSSFTAFGEESGAGPVVALNKSDSEALAILGEGVVGKALPAYPLGDTAGLMPLYDGKWSYRITAGENKGARQETVVSKAKGSRGQGLWQRVIRGDTTEFFLLEGDGVINLTSEIDLEQNVITHYAPMFPVMFDGMKPGDSSQLEAGVKVYDLEDPAHVKYDGQLKVTHTYVGAYEVTVPAGTYETVLIRSQYVGKVGPAHVVDGGYVFYAKGVGIVASVERMHVTAFLFYDKRTKTPKVLIGK